MTKQQMIRNVFRQFSQIQGFSGWMIAQLTIRLTDMPCAALQQSQYARSGNFPASAWRFAAPDSSHTTGSAAGASAVAGAPVTTGSASGASAVVGAPVTTGSASGASAVAGAPVTTGSAADASAVAGVSNSVFGVSDSANAIPISSPDASATALSSAIVRRKKERFAVLEASASTIQISMQLIRPSEKKDTPESTPACHHLTTQKIPQDIPRGQITYTAKDVRDFVQDIGDANPIHQTACPIIPGALIAETLLLRTEPPWPGGVLRFHAPACTGEQIAMYENPDSQIRYGVTVREDQPVLLWEARPI